MGVERSPMNTGQAVLVTAYGGKRIALVVVQVKYNIALVCKKDEFESAKREGREPVTVGVPLWSVKVVGSGKKC